MQQFRLGSFAFWTSVLFTTLLYMQSLKEDSAFAGFLYTGDVVNLWLPALMHSFAHTADFNFWGLDGTDAENAVGRGWRRIVFYRTQSCQKDAT